MLADSLGFTPVQAVVCSATALAGAGQFIGLALMKSGVTALGVVLATSVVNLRYVLFGAALSPYVPRAPLTAQAAVAFLLTDETFAVNIDDNRRGTADLFSMLGVGAVSWTGWVLGTTIGVLAAGWMGDPQRWGVQFAMPAMFTALLIAQAEDRRHAIVAAVASVIALASMALVPGQWHLVAAPMLAATLATLVFR